MCTVTVCIIKRQCVQDMVTYHGICYVYVYVSTNPIPHVQCQNKEKHLYMRDRMTNF